MNKSKQRGCGRVVAARKCDASRQLPPTPNILMILGPVGALQCIHTYTHTTEAFDDFLVTEPPRGLNKQETRGPGFRERVEKRGSEEPNGRTKLTTQEDYGKGRGTLVKRSPLLSSCAQGETGRGVFGFGHRDSPKGKRFSKTKTKNKAEEIQEEWWKRTPVSGQRRWNFTSTIQIQSIQARCWTVGKQGREENAREWKELGWLTQLGSQHGGGGWREGRDDGPRMIPPTDRSSVHRDPG